ncbi:diguanylate cyclase [Rhodanobacter denitrificans]|uniref:ligand-binding sensor domain-containing diguanylate cyclase n=1 Tax=Rhodanobacter denitrificans TaxID=666685 RepID=UPI000260FECD|nr:ligand-binding sensor domain-containing diguanylate cyclase [Rhodanobacter denitrificans]EIM04107.1 diguanylate cyclase with beta propeller sensor [Rhodanobacter denitrificans]UJM88829.1 diguanylate cyclase [Rhodanobacter denitrificans]
MSDAHRRRRRFRLPLAGLFLLFLLGSAARADSGDPWAPFDAPWFDQVGISDGLPHSVTTAIAQDRDGLIWIGTMGGLVRYDGYRLQVFGAGSGKAPGLPDAYVRSLLALPDGSLLIGTNTGGVARFEQADNSFRVYPVGAGGLSDRKIYALGEDHAGGVWIATENGLNHLDLRTDAIRRVDTGPDTSPRNFSVLQDRHGNLWLGNNNGLFVRRAGSDVFVRPSTPDGPAAAVLGNQIWSVMQDREGRLWAGSVQAGAAYRDTDGRWHGVPGFSGYPDGARHSTVRDLLQTAGGAVWIATDGGGVLEYTPGDTGVRRIDHDPAVPSSLPGDSVRALLRDRSGNIWAATDLGVAHHNPQARIAFSLLPSPLEGNALSDTNVHSIFVDSRGRIWLGLGAGHIDVIDLKAGRMRHLHLDGSQTQRDVRSLAEVDGSIWVGTQGLARIDPDTLAIADSVLPALHDKPVLSLRRDGTHLLIGTYDGLYRYDTRSGTLEHASHVPSDPASLASDTVRYIAQVGDDWWYGTSRGLSIARGDSLPRRFINLRHRADDSASLPQDLIGSISRGPHGQVWVSTFDGLGIVDPPVDGESWRFRTVGPAQGLSSNKVTAVLADDHGRFWASLSNGVARIDGDTHEAISLGTRDGLHIASYVNVAAARAPGGELLFGGLGGLTVIRPHWQPSPVATTPLAITNAVVNGVAMPFGKLPASGAKVTLDRGNRNLRLDFALLDYQAPMETAYSYRMDGLDEDWTNIPKGSLPSAIYTSLPHGQYRLRLRAATRGLQPRTVETDLALTVKPRWYETTLSRVVAALLLAALIATLVHLRTLYLGRQAAQLQRQVDERTRDLLVANRRLDELASTDGLTGVYNRRRFLELARLERERAQAGPSCIALFDLDRFKLINDTHGHLAGDAVIRGAIEVIRQHCRQGDLVGRYGGEEFVLCLPDTPLSLAREIAERICAALAATTVNHDGRPIPVTASIGIAALRPGESIEQWLSRADKALYEAKRAGRNRCAVAS